MYLVLFIIFSDLRCFWFVSLHQKAGGHVLITDLGTIEAHRMFWCRPPDVPALSPSRKSGISRDLRGFRLVQGSRPPPYKYKGLGPFEASTNRTKTLLLPLLYVISISQTLILLSKPNCFLSSALRRLEGFLMTLPTLEQP